MFARWAIVFSVMGCVGDATGMSSDGYGLRKALVVELREVAFQTVEFRKVHRADVAVVHMVDEIVLVVVLRIVKIGGANELGHDCAFENSCGVELCDVRGGDFLLFLRGEENCRAILCPDIRSLAILLRWVVRDAEKNHQELAIRNFGRVIYHADTFGVTGRAAANEIVIGMVDVSAAIAGRDFLDADDVLKDGLCAPEAAAGEDGDLLCGLGSKRRVKSWSRYRRRGRSRNTRKGASYVPDEGRYDCGDHERAG